MWQHDETGLIGFVDAWQIQNGWQEQNPRCKVIGPLYTHPQSSALPDEVVKDAERNEKELRRMLCICYAGPAAYMDDGEAQDARTHPFIDFMRDTPAEIQRKMFERGRATITAAAPKQEPGS